FSHTCLLYAYHSPLPSLSFSFHNSPPTAFYTLSLHDALPILYRDKGLTINHSNLCSEITLPTNEYYSFVCCLSSMNILHYDEWRSEEHTSELQSRFDLVCRLLLEKKKQQQITIK